MTIIQVTDCDCDMLANGMQHDADCDAVPFLADVRFVPKET